MKNEKKFFSAGLYLDGIKQLKLVGILFTVVIVLAAILIPLTPAVISMSADGFDIKNVQPESMNGFTSNSLAVALPLFGAPVMVFLLFGFLNKRNTSDFYHSLPHTRTCVFLSLFASVMSWVTFTLLLSGSLSVACMLILKDFYAILWKDYLLFHLGCFAASLLSASVAAAAMAVTGTAFSNLVMFLLMMFMPRFLISLFSVGVYEALPMLSSVHITPFLSYDINIINGIVFGIFAEGFGISGSLGGVTGCITNTTAIAYTALLGLIVMACACLLFNVRKSESAAKSAPNRFLQATYRVLVTMVYFSVVIIFAFIQIMHSSRFDLFFYFVLGIIGLVIYFAYELITTKKFKNLLKAMPGLAIVAGLCVVMFGAMYGITRIQLSFLPEADEVLSVSVTESRDSDGYVSFRQYAESSVSEVDLTDPELKELVCKNLKENTEYFKEKGYVGFMSKYRRYYRYDSTSYYSESYVVKTFRITTLSGDHYRNIYFKESEYKNVTEVVARDKAYRDFWLTLPDEVEDTSFLVSNNVAYYDVVESKEIDGWIDTARAELKKADFSAWHSKDLNGNGALFIIEYMMESGKLAGEYVSVAITPDIFPKTSQLYMDAVVKNQREQKNLEKTKAILNELNIDEDYVDATKRGYFNIRIYVYDEDLGGYKSHIAKYGSNEVGTVEFIMSKSENRAPAISSNEAFIVIGVGVDDKTFKPEAGLFDEDKRFSTEVLLAMPNLTDDELKSYFDLTNVSY